MQLSGGEEEVAEEERKGDLPPHLLMGEKIQSRFGGTGTFAQRDKASSPSKRTRRPLIGSDL